jgi:hypothetical protein
MKDLRHGFTSVVYDPHESGCAARSGSGFLIGKTYADRHAFGERMSHIVKPVSKRERVLEPPKSHNL